LSHCEERSFDEAIPRRFATHPRLGPVLARWREMRPLNCSSLYEYLMIAIVLQNAPVQRSVQMMRALDERFGTPVSCDGHELYVTWAPTDIHNASEEELRALKVGYRARSIKRVTEAFMSGQVDEMALRDRSREEQRRALLARYGIGPASVESILADVFHHHDAVDFPVVRIDYACVAESRAIWLSVCRAR